MWTGRQALSSINEAITSLHGQESGMDSAIQSVMAELERLRADRGRALRELARVKLDEIASGRLVSGLDASERRAAELLQGRKARLARVSEARGTQAKAMHAAEGRQQQAAEAVEATLAEVEALRVKADAAMAHMERIAAARAKLRDVESVAAEARRKAEQNAAELASKKKPYDDDLLFQYLWARGFGTSAYAHAGLTRFFDRQVASFIGYLDVRANYHMLQEIPLRLAEHAQAQGAMIDVYREALVRLEREQLDEAGMPALEGRLSRARATLADADAALEKERQALATLDAQRDQLLSGSGDPAYVEAIATLAAGDARDDVATLYAEARRTATVEDERIVARIEEIDDRIARAARRLEDLQESARTLAARRAEVESTRDRFRRSGYDHPTVVFGNDRAIADALGSVLSGAMRGAILWDVLRGGYGHAPPQSRTDLGGGFPFPMPGGFGGSAGDVSGGSWRDPGSSGPWSPPADNNGGAAQPGASDDQFSTGGRF